MKKIITLLLAAAIATTLISCSSNDKPEETPVNNNDEVTENVAIVYENVDLTAVADSLYEGIPQDNMPMVMSMPLSADDFEFFSFMPYEEGIEAVVSEPMIGSIAHSVVLVKCPDETAANRFASSMKENANPRKWVCVEADIVEGVTNGNLAMLLMTTTEGGLSETILNNFKALTPEKASELKTQAPVEEEYVEEYVDEYVEEYVDEEFTEDFTEDGEVITEEENVVIELPEIEAGDAPAMGAEEENTPAVMPEVETPAL